MKTTVLLSSRNNQFNMQIYTLAVCCCSKGCEREDSGGVRGGIVEEKDVFAPNIISCLTLLVK